MLAGSQQRAGACVYVAVWGLGLCVLIGTLGEICYEPSRQMALPRATSSITPKLGVESGRVIVQLVYF